MDSIPILSLLRFLYQDDNLLTLCDDLFEESGIGMLLSLGGKSSDIKSLDKFIYSLSLGLLISLRV